MVRPGSVHQDEVLFVFAPIFSWGPGEMGNRLLAPSEWAWGVLVYVKK